MNTFHEEEVLGKAYDSRLMKRLLTYMKPYRGQVVLAVGLMLFATAFDLLLPYLTKIALDQYIIPANSKGLLNIVWIFVGVVV